MSLTAVSSALLPVIDRNMGGRGRTIGGGLAAKPYQAVPRNLGRRLNLDGGIVYDYVEKHLHNSIIARVMVEAADNEVED